MIGTESGKYQVGTKGAWITDERKKKFLIPNNPLAASVIGIGQKILWLVQIICYAAAFVILLLKGIKFMKSAPEAKADVKKELVAYSIGAFILFGVGTLVRIIANITIDNIN